MTEQDGGKYRADYGCALAIAVHFAPAYVTDDLLECGADPNGVDHKGVPAICNAVSCHKTEQMRALITAGADLERRDINGMTPLLIAARDRNLQAVRSLLKAGADPFAKTGPDPYAACDEERDALDISDSMSGDLFGGEISKQIADAVRKARDRRTKQMRAAMEAPSGADCEMEL